MWDDKTKMMLEAANELTAEDLEIINMELSVDDLEVIQMITVSPHH